MKDDLKAATYTRRQFLEYRSIMTGTPWWDARDAVSGAAEEHSDRDLDERFTWAQWEAEEDPDGLPPTLTSVS